ncbi:energy transducer TonB [Flavobacteriales bacterium]|nr:energy transducer TonB [Flavobacteriales bacterium]
MEIKKTRKASLENKKKSIFLFGLLTSLGLLLMAFEWADHDINYTLPTMEVGELIEHEPILKEFEILRPQPKTTPPKTRQEIIDTVVISNIEDLDSAITFVKVPVVKPVIGMDTMPIAFVEPPKKITLPPVDYAEKMPEYPGGDVAMFKDLAKNIAKNNIGISGKVYVEFVIETDGSISSAKIKRGIHDIIDRDALKAVQKLKNWEPGEQNHIPVRVRLVLPINYVVR